MLKEKELVILNYLIIKHAMQCIKYKKYFNDNNSGAGTNHDSEMIDKSDMQIKLNCTETYIQSRKRFLIQS